MPTICRMIFAILLMLTAPVKIFGNVISVDTQNFNPTYNGLDFVTVQSSETLEPGIFNLGLFLNYAVNTLPFYSQPGASGAKESRLGKTRDAITSTDLSFGLGLTSWWDVGLSLPFMVLQKIYSDDSRGEYEQSGLTEVRLATKVRFVGNRSRGIGFVLSANQNMIENNPFIGTGSGQIFNFELVGDTLFFRTLAIGLNLGYRYRDAGKRLLDYPIEPVGSQYIGSIAASYLIRSIASKIIFETFASLPAEKTDSSQITRQASSAESILGIKHDISSQLSVHFGGGSELNHSYASPDWRVYLGTNWALGPVWGNDEPKELQQKTVRKVAARPKPAAPAEQATAEDDQWMKEAVASNAEYPSDADETFVLQDIHFAFDSDYRALPGAKQMLSKLSQRVTDKKFVKMTVEGHTDYVGSDEYNWELGSRRANTVRNYLMAQFGLDANKISVQTYGESRPIGDNGNYQGRQLNRRVVFRIYY